MQHYGYNQQQNYGGPPMPRIDMLMHAFVNVSPTNPAFVPGSQGIPPPMQQYVAPLAGILQLNIQQRAQETPFRTCLFNVMANNGFRNDDFIMMFEVAAWFIDLGLTPQNGQAPMFQSIDQALQVWLPHFVTMNAAAMVRQFPNLFGQLAPQDANLVNSAINEYDGVLNNAKGYRNFRMGGQPQQYGNFNAGYGNQGPRASYGGHQAPAAYNGNGIIGASSGGPGVPYRTQYNGNITEVANRRYAGNNQQNDTGNNSRWSNQDQSNNKGNGQNLNQPFAARTSSTIIEERRDMSNLNTVEEAIVWHPATSGEVIWKPTNEVPYLPLVNTSTHRLELALTDGRVIYRVVPLTEQEIMDQKQHEGFGLLAPIPASVSLKPINETLQLLGDAVSGENAEDVPGSENEKVQRVYRDGNWPHEASLEQVIFLGDLNRLQISAANGLEYDVFHTQALVTQAIAVKKDVQPMIRRIRDFTSYTELAKWMILNADDIEPALYAALDQRLTKMVNRITTQNLSLPLRIDSFVADVAELNQVIFNRYGDRVYQAFVDSQVDVLAATFHQLSDKDHDDYLRQIVSTDVPIDEDKKPTAVLLSTNFTLTYLNYRSQELGLGLVNGTPVRVTQENNPELHAIMVDSLSVAETPSRRLFRTNDGYLFELTRGYFNKEALLITAVTE